MKLINNVWAMLLLSIVLTACGSVMNLSHTYNSSIYTGKFGNYRNDSYYKAHHQVKTIYLRNTGNIRLKRIPTRKEEYFLRNIDKTIIPSSVPKNINNIVGYLLKNNWRKLGYTVVENENEADFIVEPRGSITIDYNSSLSAVLADIYLDAEIYNNKEKLGSFTILKANNNYRHVSNKHLKTHPNPFIYYKKIALDTALSLIRSESIKSF